MKLTPAGQHGLQLTRLGLMNCYLVREDDGYTLIDTNLKGSEDDILKAAGDVPIKRILITHAHVDHVGSADALVSRIAGVTLAASERSVPLLRLPPDTTLREGEVGEAKKVVGIASPVTLRLNEGDCVGSLLAISTPGHLHGHLSFLDERDGTLYAGDELATLGGLRVTGWAPCWFPVKAYSDRATAKQSAIKLLAYPIERFATGHGPVVEGGLAALEAAIAQAKL